MKNTKPKQEKMIKMLNNFMELKTEDQIYVSGIVQGIYLKKETKELSA